MEPREKAAQLPESPGVYLFKDAGGTVLYVGKARNLRSRVRSYFLESRWADAKTGSLVREIADLENILVGNEREALALEHNLIKQYRPKFNVVLRDDKTYPNSKFTAGEKFPRVYFTRRIKKDGSLYFGPYFPASLARRILHFVHKRFLIPSCTVDLTRAHPRPCLQYYIKRCLGPCVTGLTTDERYAEAARDVRLFLEGRRHDLMKSLEERMMAAAEKELFEQAAAYRDLLRTLEDIEERQRIAAAQGDDTDVLAYYAQPPLVAANLFHLRGGRVVDRREFYWEDLEEFDPKEFVPSLLKQLYLEAEYLPKAIHVSDDFEERALLEETLTERAGHKVEIFTPQRGSKREAVARRYRRLQEEKKQFPSLILIDGGIGQLHAAAQALESLQIINQPVASIAKKEEILFVLGQEDEPIVLERHSPVLHLIQQIRDETHRFAVTFHRQRRGKRQTQTALSEIPGVGVRTAQKLLKEFGSVANIQRAGLEKLSSVISRKSAEKILSQLGASTPR